MNTKANNNAEDPSDAMSIRKCIHCHARYPLSHYGLFRMGPGGYTKICKRCTSEINKTKWTRKWGRKRPLEPSTTRGVLWQNRTILTQLITMGKTELRGFDTETKMEYKIYYGPAERHGMDSLACFTRNGMVFFDTAFSGIADRMDYLLGYLKLKNIRLEWTDSDMIQSKNEIYYL